MDVWNIIDLNVYAFLLLVFVFINIKKNGVLVTKSSKMLHWVIITTMIVTLLESATYIIEVYNTAFLRFLNRVVNNLEKIFATLPVMFWIFYFDNKLFEGEGDTKKRTIFYMIPISIMLLLPLINMFFYPIIFTINENNEYVRSVGSYIMVLLSLLISVGAVVMSIIYRNKTRIVIYRMLLTLLIVPVLGVIVHQVFSVEVIIWPLMTLIIVFTYFYVEREVLIRDHLTGLVSRGTLHAVLEKSLRKQKQFTLIMLDLDKFKDINDTYGHSEGDETLKITASLINSSIKINDISCRYGGDEFMIYIESDEPNISKMIINRLQNKTNEFNDKKVKEYPISMSFGSMFIDKNNNATLSEILSTIDASMYQQKNNE